MTETPKGRRTPATSDDRALRAVATRVHRAIRIEREHDQAEAKAALQPAPSNTRWSKKVEPRKPTALERQAEQRSEERRRAWARAHPDVAAELRSLRKAQAEVHGRWKHKNEGTPATHEHASRRTQGALARLYQSGAIDAEQLASAVDIVIVAERIGADVAVRTASLETRVDVTRLGDGTFYEKLGAVRSEVAYTRWRNQVRGPIAVILDMVVGDVGFTVAAKRYRIHNRTAKQLLIDALDLWPQIRGQVCKDIDDATLAAAHAGIL